MAKKIAAPKQAVQPAQGKKITFGEDEDEEELDFAPVASSSKSPYRVTKSDRRHVQEEESGDEEESDDDAPEAVGMTQGKAAEKLELEKQRRAQDEKKRLAKERQAKIAEAKQAKLEASKKTTPKKAGKGKAAQKHNTGEDAEDDDEDTRRLRARMEKAMEQGDEDSDMSGEDFSGDEDDEEGSDDGESFHTESEGNGSGLEDEEEEDEVDEVDEVDEDDDDDSETLEEGPIDDATRRLRERMQEAMEAAERRAGLASAPKAGKIESKSKGILKNSSASHSTSAVVAEGSKKRKVASVEETADDEENWDMSAGVGDGPGFLSAAALRAAEKLHQERKARKQAKAAQESVRKVEADGNKKKKRNRRKVKREDGKKEIDGKTLQLLQPTLDLAPGSLPPVFSASSSLKGQAAGTASKTKFVKVAMKASGQIPSKGVVDGRKAVAAKRRRV